MRLETTEEEEEEEEEEGRERVCWCDSHDGRGRCLLRHLAKGAEEITAEVACRWRRVEVATAAVGRVAVALGVSGDAR